MSVSERFSDALGFAKAFECEGIIFTALGPLAFVEQAACRVIELIGFGRFAPQFVDDLSD
jgi:hypothetical protein